MVKNRKIGLSIPISSIGCHPIPVSRCCVVLRYTRPELICSPKIQLRSNVTLLCCFLPPAHGFGIVLGKIGTLVVSIGERRLSYRITRLRSDFELSWSLGAKDGHNAEYRENERHGANIRSKG